MFPGASAWAYTVDADTNKPKFRQMFFAPFKGPDGDCGANQVAISYSMCSASKNKDAAWAYLSFMTSEAAQQAAYAPDPNNAGNTIRCGWTKIRLRSTMAFRRLLQTTN
jgi:ABC-type glycerol-3-phosphate transport system substrate-binding protein